MGLGHTCALLKDETTRCWELNAEGQLGIGNTFSDLNIHREAKATGDQLVKKQESDRKICRVSERVF